MPLPKRPIEGAARFITIVFGIVFVGIGLTLISFLWTADGFGAPPLFFKIFGSFIALAAVAFGGTMVFISLKGATSEQSIAASAFKPDASAGTRYACPACGAHLGSHADVSPKGDVKCGYCDKWFNVHG